MKRVFAGVLTLVLCCATWLVAADSQKKKPVSKQAATSSAQFQRMQAQLKKQQEQIAKLLAELEQSRKALQEAQQNIQAGAQQTQKQAVATEQKANSLNDQLMGMQADVSVHRREAARQVKLATADSEGFDSGIGSSGSRLTRLLLGFNRLEWSLPAL